MGLMSIVAFGADAAFPGSGALIRIWSAITGFLKKIPWQVWLAIGVAVAILIGIHVIDRKISNARTEGYAAGVAAEKAAVKAAQDKADAAQRAKNQAHATASASIDTEKTNAYLDANDDIDRRAAALQLRHDQAIAGGAGGLHPLPATIETPGGIAPPATCDGLSWDAQLAVLTTAAKLQAQLNAVLDWEDAQDALAAKDGTDGEQTEAEKVAAGP
jgi:hypothetical protein